MLLLNTYEWFQAVIEMYYTAFGTYASYSKNRIKTCTSVVIEYLQAVPGSNRSVLCSLRNLSFCIPKNVSKLALVLL